MATRRLPVLDVAGKILDHYFPDRLTDAGLTATIAARSPERLASST